MKYPYITGNEVSSFVVYEQGQMLLIGDEHNGFSRGLKVTTNETDQPNTTREVLTNTYGKVESKEHAEFIVDLAITEGFNDLTSFDEDCPCWFCFDYDELYFFDNEQDASSDGEKLITIPLPPKQDDSDDWPKVGDEVIIDISGYYVVYGQSVDGLTCKVLSIFKDGDTTVYAVNRDGVNYCFVKELLQKPKTPEEDLREKSIKEISQQIRNSHPSTGWIESEKIASDLYDAGFLK